MSNHIPISVAHPLQTMCIYIYTYIYIYTPRYQSDLQVWTTCFWCTMYYVGGVLKWRYPWIPPNHPSHFIIIVLKLMVLVIPILGNTHIYNIYIYIYIYNKYIYNNIYIYICDYYICITYIYIYIVWLYMYHRMSIPPTLQPSTVIQRLASFHDFLQQLH